MWAYTCMPLPWLPAHIGQPWLRQRHLCGHDHSALVHALSQSMDRLLPFLIRLRCIACLHSLPSQNSSTL